jgi:translation initiation factor IF-3
LRINEQIRIPQVRLFDDTTDEALGIVPIETARQLAVVQLKEQKLRPKISDHDFRTKLAKVKQFLGEGDKVKLTIMFRGREMVHQEFGRKLLDRMTEELSELAIIERSPLVEGRNMIMILSPTTKKQARPDRPHGDAHPTAGNGAAQPARASEATSAPPAATATAVATAPEPVPDPAGADTNAAAAAAAPDTPPAAPTKSPPKTLPATPAASSAKSSAKRPARGAASGATAESATQNTETHAAQPRRGANAKDSDA